MLCLLFPPLLESICVVSYLEASKHQLIFLSLGVAVLFVVGTMYVKPLLQDVPVFSLVPTNQPPLPIPVSMGHLIPTNNWVVEVPYDPAQSVVSQKDIREIKRLGVMSGWWPKRIDRIVIDSADRVWIDYPTDSKSVLHRLTIVREHGEWRRSGVSKLK